MKVYFDTSAAAKLLRPEAETPAMRDFIDQSWVEPFGSWLLVAELRRLAARWSISQAAATEVIAGFHILPIFEYDYELAGTMADPTLRSLDALHLTVAAQAQVDFLITYDARMKDAALRLYGIPVLEPGADGNTVPKLPPGYEFV